VSAGGPRVTANDGSRACYGASLAGARFLSLAATATIHLLAFAGILAATGVSVGSGGKRAQHIAVVSLPPLSSPPPSEIAPERQGKGQSAAAPVTLPTASVGGASPETARETVPALATNAGALLPPAEVPASPQAPATTPAGDAMEQYKLRIWRQILAHRPRGVQASGTTVIGLQISPGGSLLASEIASSSGNMNLDRIALRTVRQSAPFPPAPATLGAERLAFAVPMEFR